jgi:formylglycine-generating enzyme required for sulfatase activity
VLDAATELPPALWRTLWPPRTPLARWRDRIPGLSDQACPEMVTLPTGRFVMGSPEGEEGRSNAEGPQHEVVIRTPLAVGKYPVTVGDYGAFVAATDRKHEGGTHFWTGSSWMQDYKRDWRSPGFAQDDGHPVTCVSWHDAQAYCAWLNEQLELPRGAYRLPTEAEWEYACRAGTTTPFSFGRTITSAEANFNGAYIYGGGYNIGGGTIGKYRGGTVPSGSLPANSWGLHEMHGNVWDWVEDMWKESYHGAPSDAAVAVIGNWNDRPVVRGGTWNNPPDLLRSACRAWVAPANRFSDGGFRLARTLRA